MEFNMSFPKELNKVKENRIPFVICGGTVEYHGPHCSYGCDTLVAEGLIKQGLTVKKGVFGAEMKITQTNDGPFTVILEK